MCSAGAWNWNLTADLCENIPTINTKDSLEVEGGRGGGVSMDNSFNESVLTNWDFRGLRDYH